MKKTEIAKQSEQLWKKLLMNLQETCSIHCIISHPATNADHIFGICLSPEYGFDTGHLVNANCSVSFYGNNYCTIDLSKIQEHEDYFGRFKNYHAKIDEIVLKHGSKNTFIKTTWQEAYWVMKELCDAIEKDVIVFPPTV